ncbi:MAG: FAD-dependent monooxygenase [Thaumarchaeota archaeon]|nr:FAD-dependent monooxygenase [Nitrososphaerota archaeon]
MVKVDRILIVGGGIGGLSLATALRLQGFKPELIERNTTWPEIGAGINLPANGVRVLRALGVGEAAHRTSEDIRSWGFFDEQGELLCKTDLVDLWREVGPSVGITRVRLQDALLTGASSVPHRLGVSLKHLMQDDEGVSVSFSDGTSGFYDLVVGADGIHSIVREVGIKHSPPSFAGMVVWRSLISTRPQRVVDFMTFMGEGRIFGVVPMGEGYTYGFGLVESARFEDPLEGRLERFRSRFEGFGGPVPEYLDALERDEQLHFGPIEWVELDEWHKGRVVLIGDAAHAGPPHMGEGGCMAMEDSLVLAEVLRNADNLQKAMEAYVRRRQPRAGWVQEQSRAAAKAWVLPVAVRNATLRERGDQMFRARYTPLIPPP